MIGNRKLQVKARHYKAINGKPVKDQVAWLNWQNNPKFMKTGIRNNGHKYDADFKDTPDFIQAFHKQGKSLFKTIKRRADIQNLLRPLKKTTGTRKKNKGSKRRRARSV
jgi:hypothetical protein